MTRRIDFVTVALPILGLGVMLLIWTILSTTVARDLPSPMKTWEESKQYVLNPFFKDGEMNQGIGRFAFLSLIRVAKGFLLAIVIGTPLGFLLGLSGFFCRTFDPVIQILRPISPLAWLPLGRRNDCRSRGKRKIPVTNSGCCGRSAKLGRDLHWFSEAGFEHPLGFKKARENTAERRV